MLHNDFVKVINPGRVSSDHAHPIPLFAKIIFSEGRLSISGVEGPMKNGNARGACGQLCVMFDQASFKSFEDGWDADKAKRFFDVWDRWHLNDMRAGSPRQNAWIEQHHDEADRFNYFQWACNGLKEAGLQPDTEYLHGGKPYAYGSAWLREEVPNDIIEFLASLPDSKITPAWV